MGPGKTSVLQSVAVVTVLSMVIRPDGAEAEQPDAPLATRPIWVFAQECYGRFSFAFAFTEKGVLAQKATCPGYWERWLYWRGDLPQELRREFEAVTRVAAEVAYPWPEQYDFHGPAFVRIAVPSDERAPVQRAGFGGENKRIETFLRSLQSNVMQEKYRIHQVPEWVLQDLRVRASLGFFPGLSTDPQVFRPISAEEMKWAETLVRKLHEADEQARKLVREGEHLRAALQFSQIAAAKALLVPKLPKRVAPDGWEEEALKQFRAAGKGQAYEQLLWMKYPSWKPPQAPQPDKPANPRKR